VQLWLCRSNCCHHDPTLLAAEKLAGLQSLGRAGFQASVKFFDFLIPSRLQPAAATLFLEFSAACLDGEKSAVSIGKLFSGRYRPILRKEAT
jgi:hypothetical protein